MFSLPWDYEIINCHAKIRIISEKVGKLPKKRISKMRSGKNFGIRSLENRWGRAGKFGRTVREGWVLYIIKVYWEGFGLNRKAGSGTWDRFPGIILRRAGEGSGLLGREDGPVVIE